MSMNPRETTDKIRDDYQEYIESILTVKDTELTELARKAVAKTEFVKGPYLETTLPFVQGKSLKELVDEGLLSAEFAKMGRAVHYADWQLRIHQEKALRKCVGEQHNMIVSTGTGSGKTECYLYPILNEIMREKEAGTLNPGVRALLIFPMNALANDQQKKLRKLLAGYPDITFGRYTGETQHKTDRETADQAEKRLHKDYDSEHQNDQEAALRKSIPNELMCREKMAETPPHILLTNYAMLEYMLLQPDTAPFFDNKSAEHWRFIVIDEAHTYKGATGTEIAFLLRRLKERIRHNMHGNFRCIATSATLGGDDAKESLAQFATALFGEPFTAADVITTTRQKRVVPDDGKAFAPDDYKRLKSETSGLAEEQRGKALYSELCHDLRLFSVYKALQSIPRRIEDVASSVFPDIIGIHEQEAALIDLIELAAAAKPSMDDAALLPARYHLFVKSLEGMFAEYYPRKNVYLDRRETVQIGDNHYPVFELANCQKCNQEYLVGKTVNGYLLHTSEMEKPEYYLISNSDIKNGMAMDEDDSVEEANDAKLSSLEKYHLCLACGKITPVENASGDCCNIEDPSKIVTVYNLKYAGKSKESSCCPCCGATKKGLIKRFLTANQPATFAVAKSLYDAIPPRPATGAIKVSAASDLFDDSLFDFSEDDETPKVDQSVIDESGRKLLIFSDNRQEAAFFAGFFEKKYRQVMWRRLILKSLKQAENGELSVDDLISRVRNEAEKAGMYAYDQERMADMTADQKIAMASHYVMSEFMDAENATALAGLGYVKVRPGRIPIGDTAEYAGLKGDQLRELLTFMMDTFRQKGACTFPDGIHPEDDFFAPRNQPGYFRKMDSKSFAGKAIYGFMPSESRTNKRLAMMLKVCGVKDTSYEAAIEQATKQLEGLYDNFFVPLLCDERVRLLVVSSDTRLGTLMRINHAKWKFAYIKPEDTIYKCDKCGKVFTYDVNGLCPEMKCNGTLIPIAASEIQKTPYYNKVYSETSVIPMVAREHTAQLSSKTAGVYQKEFEEGKINVLSCSTTFEMGVDVGELEATFQRNVPPETSNYIQRAGRAGRRTSSAAFSVTFARRSSHDMTFFNNPPQIIAGKINAPILEVTNEKIAQRHLNSVVISWFFRKEPEYFFGNVQRIIGSDKQENMATSMRKLLELHPDDLMDSIRIAVPSDICKKLNVDDWAFVDEITGDEGVLTRAIDERSHELQSLRKYMDELYQAGKMTVAPNNLIKTLQAERAISFLSAKGVIPKYGFPIDTVSLDIISGNTDEAKKIDLSRDLKMAISEFAPPAEIVANGRVWKSYAINTVPNRSWPTYIYYECPKCKQIIPPDRHMVDVTANLHEAEEKICRQCGEKMNARKFIVPLFGFSTNIHDKPKPVGESKPKAYYATQTQFWGIGDDITEMQKAEARSQSLDFAGKQVNVTYSPGGKLFVLNQGTNERGFFVCPVCGYATDPATLPHGKHNTKYDHACGNTALQSVSLGHSFSTDVLRVSLPPHSLQIEGKEHMEGKDKYLSVLYALLEGASTALDISREDISGCVTYISGEKELVLYDDTPGGSGFVKQIYNRFGDVLKAALKKVSGNCGCSEETSCYGCLRNYANQHFHDHLSRGLAAEYINWILFGKESRTKELSESPCENVSLIPEVPSQPETEKEPVGRKVYDYEVPSYAIGEDTASALETLADDLEDPLKKHLLEIAEFARNADYEMALKDQNLQLENGSVWPELVWPESHVALFLDAWDQYSHLKNYNWHCYQLTEDLMPAVLFRYIKGGNH